ncbi:conserved Plasmodium protein, unknown function [Plasmodium relictum]|uniref:RNA-binding protein n=1 Tax=Plasmodium relictum TaxID=85471 RepID=A0A1J1H5K7_PLARL|nr:conserved Plasmodium protein, unknown function [Plasmodium relictum]CRH00192.1 conserved Plasmodium protein, unknown function [Plasmodium relictum]
MQGKERNNDIFSTNNNLNKNSLDNSAFFDKNMKHCNRLKILSVSTEADSHRCSTNSLSNMLNSNNINNYNINFSSTSYSENDYILNALKELGNNYKTNKDFKSNSSLLNLKPCSIIYDNKITEQNINGETYLFSQEKDKNNENNILVSNTKNDDEQKYLSVCPDTNKLNLYTFEKNEIKHNLCNENNIYENIPINSKVKLLPYFEKINEQNSDEVQINSFSISNNVYNNMIKVSENMKNNNNNNIKKINVKDTMEKKKEKKLVNTNQDIENKLIKNITNNNISDTFDENVVNVTVDEDIYNNNVANNENKNNYNNSNKDEGSYNINNNEDSYNNKVDIGENNNGNYNNYNVLLEKHENEVLSINNSENIPKNNKFKFNCNKNSILFNATEKITNEQSINKDSNDNFNFKMSDNLINVSRNIKDSSFKNNLKEFFEKVENENSNYIDKNNINNCMKSNKRDEEIIESDISKIKLPFINLKKVNKNSYNISDTTVNKLSEQNYFNNTFDNTITDMNETKEMESFDENYFYDLKSNEILFFEKERDNKIFNSNIEENFKYLSGVIINNTNNCSEASVNFSEYDNEHKNNYTYEHENNLMISKVNFKLLEKNLLKENILYNNFPFNKTNECVELNIDGGSNYNNYQNCKENNNIFIQEKMLNSIYNNNENFDKLSSIDKISTKRTLKSNKNLYISELLNDKGNNNSSIMNNENYNSFTVIDNLSNPETMNKKKLIFMDNTDENIFLDNKMNSKDLSDKNLDKDIMDIYNINHNKHISNEKLFISEDLNSYNNILSSLSSKNDDFINSYTNSKFNFKNKFYDDYFFSDNFIDEKNDKYEDIMKYFDYSVNNNNINSHDNIEETNSKDTDSKSRNSLAKFTLIVNVPPNTTRKDLMAVFSKFGNVDLTMVVCDKQSRHPNKEWTATSGYAFVRFATNLEAQRTLNATTSGLVRIRGSRVRATWAKKDSYSKREKETTFKIPSSILIINVEEFICSICKTNLSYEPRLFPCCYASCCSDCLRSYIMNEENQENIKCPNCSLSFSERIIKIDKNSKGAMALLYKFHCNIKVRCPNECCKWIGFQYQYLNHILSCKFNQT